MFFTDHGVNGEEYMNVLFVVGRGGNDYKFDTILSQTESELNEKDVATYRRNRNLFYVCCSRSIHNLALIITIPVEGAFKDYLERIFNPEDIVGYTDFIAGKNCDGSRKAES